MSRLGSASPPRPAVNDRLPLDGFVRSTDSPLGVGKLVHFDRTTATIDFFVGPGCPPVAACVPVRSVQRAELACETRVYRRMPDGVSWRGGRALAKHNDQYIVRFPNSKDPQLVPEGELFTRCDRPLPDPTVFLAARITETPLWQEGRGKFVRAVIEQRGAAAGMTALLSAGIDLEPHQIEVVRRVLQDPVQRYLLADEVGLGKTIEAGVILRQYVLDRPHDHDVLVLVPAHLVRQWEGELEHRFRLGPLLGGSVRVLPHGSPEADVADPPGLLVIDEAHQLSRGLGTPAFDTVRRLAADPRVRLLLLSATPTLHSDAAVYPIGDTAVFGNRQAERPPGEARGTMLSPLATARRTTLAGVEMPAAHHERSTRPETRRAMPRSGRILGRHLRRLPLASPDCAQGASAPGFRP
jgi:ATP-dependent helicase HepA